MLSLFLINSLTTQALTDAFDFMDENVARSAWLSTKLAYFKRQSTLTRKDLRTYRRAWIDRYYAENYLNSMIGAPQRPAGKEIGSAIKDSLPKGSLAEVKPLLKQHVEGMITKQQKFAGGLDINNSSDISNLVFDLYDEVRDLYRDEMELTVRWLLIASQNARALKNQEKEKYFRFIEEQQNVFHALGIKVIVPVNGSVESRYRELMQQIDSLAPDQRTLFKQVRALHQE